MRITSLKLAALALGVGLSVPALADDTHHPATAQAQPAPAQTSQGQPRQPMRPGMSPDGMGMMGQGGMMDGGMAAGGMMGMQGMPMMAMMHMMAGDEHIEGRIAFIKAELKITDAQEKTWTEFADALRKAAATSRETHHRMGAMSGSPGEVALPQLVDQHEKRLANRLEAAQTIKAALTPFYSDLSDEQKKTLAQLYPMFIGMM